MITHLQETWKIQNKVTYSSTKYCNYFLSRKITFLVGVSIPNSQKWIEWIDKKVEAYSRPEKHHEPIQHNQDLNNFHTIVGYKLY